MGERDPVHAGGKRRRVNSTNHLRRGGCRGSPGVTALSVGRISGWVSPSCGQSGCYRARLPPVGTAEPRLERGGAARPGLANSHPPPPATQHNTRVGAEGRAGARSPGAPGTHGRCAGNTRHTRRSPQAPPRPHVPHAPGLTAPYRAGPPAATRETERRAVRPSPRPRSAPPPGAGPGADHAPPRGA